MGDRAETARGTGPLGRVLGGRPIERGLARVSGWAFQARANYIGVGEVPLPIVIELSRDIVLRSIRFEAVGLSPVPGFFYALPAFATARIELSGAGLASESFNRVQFGPVLGSPSIVMDWVWSGVSDLRDLGWTLPKGSRLSVTIGNVTVAPCLYDATILFLGESQ